MYLSFCLNRNRCLNKSVSERSSKIIDAFGYSTVNRDCALGHLHRVHLLVKHRQKSQVL